MVYVITGATGNVGSLVVERLIARGDRPRIFVRNAEKARVRYGDRVDIFTGDLADAKTLSPVLAGADTLFLVNSGPDLEALDGSAAKTAKVAGVKHIVKLSSYDAREQNIGTGVWHAAGEAAIRASGIPFTFVQPSGFMVNALWWARSIKGESIVRSATGEGKIPFIHSDDIADVAVRALTALEYAGQSLAITGSEALSYADMTAKIGAALGTSLRFEPISEDEERRKMVSRSEPEEIIAAHLSIWGHLHPCRYVLHDRDTKFCAAFRSTLADGGVKTIRLPARSPNLNAFAERWVRSVKQECLSKLILFGEGPLSRALVEFSAHYHSERNHQGKDNKLLFPEAGDKPIKRGRPVECHHRLGGLLKYYGRAA